MCGKKLVNNLKWFIESNYDTDLSVTVFDTNLEQDSPFISIGFVDDTLDDSGCSGHYSVKGVIVTALNGHDYTDTEIDAVEQDLLDTVSLSSFHTDMNSLSTRPHTDLYINDLFITGTDRQVEGDSTTVSIINLEAYCALRV